MTTADRQNIAPHDVDLAADVNTSHLLILGGVHGASEGALEQILQGIIARGERAFIADPLGLYCRRLFSERRGDVILDPSDARSLKWDPFGEILAIDRDVESLARALVVSTMPRSRNDFASLTFFSEAIRMLEHLIRGMCEEGLHDVATLRDRLYSPTADSSSDPFSWPEVGHAASAAVEILEYVVEQRSAPFSVRNWVSSGNGLLFVPYRLRSPNSRWVGALAYLTMHALLDGEKGHDTRTWLLINALDSIGPIHELRFMLERVGAYGGRAVCALLNYSSMVEAYGLENWPTPMDWGSTLILSCTLRTAEYAAQLTGIYPPFEFDRLEQGYGFLQVSSVPGWRRVRAPTA